MTDFINTIKILIDIIQHNGVVGLLIILLAGFIFFAYRASKFAISKFEEIQQRHQQEFQAVADRHEREMAEFRKYMTDKNGHFEKVVEKVLTSFDASVDKMNASLYDLSHKFEAMDKEASIRGVAITSSIDTIKEVLLKKK